MHDVEAAFPAWLPDGQYIAFHSVRGWSSRFNIYVVRADSSEERMVVDGEQAAWSPDSRQLVYKGCEGANCGLMIVNIDGSGKRRLTTCAGCANDGNADWSRDTNRIVFTSERDGNHEIYVMNPDGSGQTRLTDNPGPDVLPVWLPGGREIAFRSFRDGAWGIYIMNADGSNVRKVVDARVDPNRWIWEKMAATRP
ncbi:MAG: TolB family protein [Anaerolineae bacterium]